MYDCSALSKEDLLDTRVIDAILSLEDEHDRACAKVAYFDRAKKLKCKTDARRLYETRQKSIARVGQIGNGSNQTNFPEGRPSLKLPEEKWITSKDGISWLKFDNNTGEFEQKCCCATPVTVTAILRDADTRTEKIRLAFHIDGKWHDAVVDRETLASHTKIVTLSNHGISVNQNNAAKLCEFLTDCIDTNRDDLDHVTLVSHLGWHGDSFVPYADNIKFDPESEGKEIFDMIKCSGDFEVWKAHMLKLRRNVPFRLMMGAAFASPLLSKINALPFILHLWGTTGFGKSVSLMATMSIWGDPATGKLTKSMNMTVNAMNTHAVTLRDLPFAGDELQTIKHAFKGDYDNLIMTLCEGVDRSRLSTQSTLKKTGSWNCAFIFTGEEPITHSGSGGGAVNRVIEIECTDRIIEDGNETVSVVKSNYGHAGRLYIDYIKRYADSLSDTYGGYTSELSKLGVTEKQAMSMAAILLGDTYASQCLFADDEELLTIDDVKDFMKKIEEVDTAKRAYEHTRESIYINKTRFDHNRPEPSFEGKPVERLPQGDSFAETWGKFDGEGMVSIYQSALEDILRKGGFVFDAVKKKWADKGYLIKNSQGRYAHQTTINKAKANLVRLNLSAD